MLLLRNASQCNWLQLNYCKVLQPVIDKNWKTNDKMMESNFKGYSIIFTNLFCRHKHLCMDKTHSHAHNIHRQVTHTSALPPQGPVFIWLILYFYIGRGEDV